jgi:uncharacterized membrane protein
MSLRLFQPAPVLAAVDALAQPWQKLYAHSTVVATLVLFGHAAGLLVAGALTLSTEANALRLEPSDDDARRRYFRNVTPARGSIALALAVAMLSGVLLFLTDLEAFAVSTIFWTKMGLVALLLMNAVVASRLDARLLRASDDASAEEHLWRRRRASARASAVLWFALVLWGSALASR